MSQVPFAGINPTGIVPLIKTQPIPQIAPQTIPPTAKPSATSELKTADQLSPLAAAGKAEPILALSDIKASSTQVQAAIDKATSNSYQRTPAQVGENRHSLRQRLQNTDKNGIGDPQGRIKYDGSEIVVIAFEGTGAYEPRQTPIMQEAAALLRQQGLSIEDASLANKATEAIQSHEGRDESSKHWSGLASGPMESLLENEALQAHSQWLSFPSEEIELLAGLEAVKDMSPSKVLDAIKQAKGSYDGETAGINGALKAVEEIQAQARAQGKNPRFVIVTHSSGGRSAVKFLEKAKALNGTDGKPLKFENLITIDPVREAQEAVGESIKEFINKGTEHNLNRLREAGRLLGLDTPNSKVYPATVRSHKQPESLYKPGNVKQALNFYQQKDTLGLKMVEAKDLAGLSTYQRWMKEAMMFGIHGSPVSGAENIEIHDRVGQAGHGEIAYHPQVIQRFTESLEALLP